MTKQNLIPIIIDKMLEKHGVDYAYVLENQQIEGVPWYTYYTFTKQEEKEFKEWFIKFVSKKIKFSKNYIEREYALFSLMYGLRIE